MIGDLPDELRTLFSAERIAPVANTAARQLVRVKLSATLGIAAPAAVTTSALGITKLLGIVLGVVGMTTVVAIAVAPAAPAPAPRIAHVASPPVEPARSEVVPDAPVVRAEAVVAPPLEPTRQRPAPRVRPQIDILAEATRALTDGDAHRVLALVDEDRRAHRDGSLAEEREALRLAALLSLDRTAEARAAATRFLTRYPRTSHRALVDRALATEAR